MATLKDAMLEAETLIPGIDAAGGLYPIEKLEAHQRGVLHAAVSVFVFDGPRLLIQQRAAGKYHCPLLWANTCCTHPHWGEDAATAARRRLREELGVDLPLAPAGRLTYRAEVTGGLVEHEAVQAFTAEVRAEGLALALALDPHEVAAVRWAAPAALRAEAAATPDAFAPWFRIYLDRWAELALGR